jgi:Na+(H+)/acetate symporter ActP
VTIPEVFEVRYGNAARVLSAVCIILAYVGIVSAQFKAVGFIINLTTGLDVNIATIIAAVAIVALTVSGGMVAVAYSDAYSALLMVGGFFSLQFCCSQNRRTWNRVRQPPRGQEHHHRRAELCAAPGLHAAHDVFDTRRPEHDAALQRRQGFHGCQEVEHRKCSSER